MQVEYAMEAINNAGSTVGVLCPEGIVIGAERKQTSKLLERAKYSEKMYQIDSHIVCAAAGLTADANILINYARNDLPRLPIQLPPADSSRAVSETIVQREARIHTARRTRDLLACLSSTQAGTPYMARNCTARTLAETTLGGRRSLSALIISPPVEY